jgi:hypothetical protein
MPENIDRSLDVLAERYDMALPMGDLFYSSAEKALLSDTTTGGHVGIENVGDTPLFTGLQDVGVDWELWLPVRGEPPPKRLKVLQKRRTVSPWSTRRSRLGISRRRSPMPRSSRSCRRTTRASPCCSGRGDQEGRAAGGAHRAGHQEVVERVEVGRECLISEGSPRVMRQPSTGRKIIYALVAAAVVTMAGLAPTLAQVRASRRGAVAKGDDATVAAGPRGAAVKGEEAYAAAGRRGAVVSGDEGYAAVGRHGNVVTGEEVDVQGGAVGRHGAVVVGEEGPWPGAVTAAWWSATATRATRLGRPWQRWVPALRSAPCWRNRRPPRRPSSSPKRPTLS